MPEQHSDIAGFTTALRQSDSRAMREYFARFTPLLREVAKRLGVPPGQRREVVVTVLDDVLLGILNGKCDPRPDMEGYLIVALRNHVFLEARRERRRLRGTEELTLDSRLVGRRAMSEDAPRDDADPNSAAAILADVYHVVLARFPDSERELIAYALEHVPARKVGEWLGIDHSAAKMRLHRIVRRLRIAILDEVALLPALERRTAERLLLRAGISAARDDKVKARVAEVPRGSSYPDSSRTREVS